MAENNDRKLWLHDIPEAKNVEILVRDDTKVIQVNVDGHCVLYIHQIENLFYHITDK